MSLGDTDHAVAVHDFGLVQSSEHLPELVLGSGEHVLEPAYIGRHLKSRVSTECRRANQFHFIGIFGW